MKGEAAHATGAAQAQAQAVIGNGPGLGGIAPAMGLCAPPIFYCIFSRHIYL